MIPKTGDDKNPFKIIAKSQVATNTAINKKGYCKQT
jgi:hypothetical protein